MKRAIASVSVASLFVLPSCTVSEDGSPETRPVGEPVLSVTELAQAGEKPDFKRHVWPILEERCVYCHDGKEMPGKLNLSTRAGAFRDPRIIVPGNADGSALIVALTTGNHALSMPAVGKAPPPEEIAVLRKWIDLGAEWPE